MNTAVIINLNYDNNQGPHCKSLWQLIESRMLACGFTKTGRGFVTDAHVYIASELAQTVLGRIEADYRACGRALRPLIREFYCVPDLKIIDLWRPSVNSIEVRQLDASAFERFFGAAPTASHAH